MVFTTKTEGVYCAVRAKYLNVVQGNVNLERVQRTKEKVAKANASAR
jgi:hypothetical protein